MHGEASCGGDSCLSTAITGELGTTSILKFLVILEFQDRVVKASASFLNRMQYGHCCC